MYAMNVAAVLWGPKEPLVIQEICVDPPKEMEVRVKILYSSICHTDLGFWTGAVLHLYSNQYKSCMLLDLTLYI